MVSPPCSITVDLVRRRSLRALLQAQDEHDQIRRAFRAGATDAALKSDLGRWTKIGAAVAELARLIQSEFNASHFGDARPDPELLIARISEAIDDQLDEPVWVVIDAAARLFGMDVALPMPRKAS